MKIIGVTQRVAIDGKTGERRDALDQRWYPFFQACGLLPFGLPNHLPSVAEHLRRQKLAGIVLTGGYDLAAYGGDVPERDEVERELIAQSLAGRFPLLGVCRGMQSILDRMGVALEKVPGHVSESQAIRIETER